MNYSLINIYTKNFYLDNNKIKDKEYNIKPEIGKNIEKINDNSYEVQLKFRIKGNSENETPFDLELIIAGVFSFKDFSQEDIDKFLKINAVYILFPYLRSTLSTVMSSLMMKPILIPVIDVKTFFNED